MKAAYRLTEDPEKRRSYQKTYHAEARQNPAFRERVASGIVEWRKKNPIAQSQRRRALMMSAEGKMTGQEWEAIKVAQHGCCFDCGREAKLIIGHLHPLSRGGSHYASNIVGQCRSCNSKQGNKIHPSAGKSALRAGFVTSAAQKKVPEVDTDISGTRIVTSPSPALVDSRSRRGTNTMGGIVLTLRCARLNSNTE